MNKQGLKWGVAAVVCMFSFAASAQMIEVRPRVEESVVRPGAEDGRMNVRDTSKSSSTNSAFSNLQTRRSKVVQPAPTAANDNKQQKPEACSKSAFVAQLVAGTDLDQAAVMNAANTPALAGHVTMGECQANAGGLPSYDGVAKANFGKAWVIVADRERGLSSVTRDVAKNDWTIALSGVLQESPEQAGQLFDKLASPQSAGGCGILANY